MTGLVVGIQDGDTLTVLIDRQQLRIRIAEIDAPEKAQPFGSRSRQSLATLCNQKPASVRPVTRDRYGRTVAAVSCSGSDVATHQVRTGMAWVYNRYASPASPLYPLQDAARAAGAGLWADHSPVAPWDWRKK
jgi:endonuclease YncB( thermonuclease family)